MNGVDFTCANEKHLPVNKEQPVAKSEDVNDFDSVLKEGISFGSVNDKLKEAMQAATGQYGQDIGGISENNE